MAKKTKNQLILARYIEAADPYDIGPKPGLGRRALEVLLPTMKMDRVEKWLKTPEGRRFSDEREKAYIDKSRSDRLSKEKSRKDNLVDDLGLPHQKAKATPEATAAKSLEIIKDSGIRYYRGMLDSYNLYTKTKLPKSEVGSPWYNRDRYLGWINDNGNIWAHNLYRDLEHEFSAIATPKLKGVWRDKLGAYVVRAMGDISSKIRPKPDHNNPFAIYVNDPGVAWAKSYNYIDRKRTNTRDWTAHD